MLNGKYRAPAPQPSPACVGIAPLLPVLEDLPAEMPLAVEVHAHLASCAYCRAQRGAYERFDEALQHHFGLDASPFFTTEQIMQGIRDDLPDGAPVSEHGDGAEDMSHISVVPRPRTPHYSRRVPSAAASLAAVLLIALLAGAG